jgi:hypothetical protein
MVSGALLVALGLAMLSVRPRRRHVVLFGVFAAAFGLQFVPANLHHGDLLTPAAATLLVVGQAVLWIVAAVALAAFALAPLGRRLARPRALVLAGPLLFLAASVALAVVDREDAAARAGWLAGDGAMLAMMVVNGLAVATLLAALLHWAAASVSDPSSRGPLALLSAGLAVYPVFLAGGAFTSLHEGVAPAGYEGAAAPLAFAVNLLHAALPVAIAATWLVATRTGPATRAPRNVALLVFGVMAANGLIGLLPGDFYGWLGIARTLGVAIVAYAILRHQLFGLDVKVKWTIKSGTIAAVFVAVIFAASEGAQRLFGAGNEWLGIAAGAMLVFALAPLQRFAEKVSDKAMPGVKPVVRMDAAEKEYAYEQAALLAWRDGSVSRDERALLDGLRARLGLDAETAMRLETGAAVPRRVNS